MLRSPVAVAAQLHCMLLMGGAADALSRGTENYSEKIQYDLQNSAYANHNKHALRRTECGHL